MHGRETLRTTQGTLILWTVLSCNLNFKLDSQLHFKEQENMPNTKFHLKTIPSLAQTRLLNMCLF